MILRRPAGPALALAVLGSALSPEAVRSQEACTGEIVSEITYERLKPFDDEATAPDATFGGIFRALNHIHVRTLPKVIRWEMLFEEGDCVEPVDIEESARALRSLPYIQDASITTTRRDDGTLSAHVRTRDLWALAVSIGFTVDNGFQITGLSFNARNAFGTGTQLGYFRNVYRERKRLGLVLRQPNLFGTRVDVVAQGGRTRSGRYWDQSFFRPFTGEVGVNAFREAVQVRDDFFSYSVDPSLGFTQAYLRHEIETYELVYQRRFGPVDGARFITGLGVSREEIRFPFGPEGVRVVVDDSFDESSPAPGEVAAELSPQAADHSANRVSVTLGMRQMSFLKLVGLDALDAFQDVQDGLDLTFTAAPGFNRAGARTLDDVLVRLQGDFGLPLASAYFHVRGDAQGRRVWEDEPGSTPTGWRDFLYQLDGDAYWTQTETALLFGRVQFAGGRNSDRPFQLTLGGREAVRGYDEDAYPGDRRVVMTVEQRLRIPSLSTGFMDLGVVAFADAGRIWAGEAPFGETTGWKAGIGAGLRLGLPSGARTVMRIDVGTPLTGDRATRGTVFRVYAELLGILDRRTWPSQIDRSRWYGIDPDLTTRPMNPLAGS